MRRSMKTAGALAILALAAAGAPFGEARAGEPPSAGVGAHESHVVELLPSFTAEPETAYEQSLRIVQKRLMGNEQTLEALLKRIIVVRTIESNDTGATIEMSIPRVALKITPPVMKTFEFDSDRAPIENPRTKLADSLHALAKVIVRLEVTPSGVATLVSGREELQAALNLDPKREMAAYFSEQALVELANDIFGIAAEAPRTVGDVWSRQETTELGGVPNVHLGLEFKLKSVEDGVAVIEGKGTFILPEQPPVVEGLKSTIKDQSSYFHIRWSTTLGRLLGLRSEQMILMDQGGDVMNVGMQLATIGDLRRMDPAPPEAGPGVELPPRTIVEPPPEDIPPRPRQ